YFFNKRGGCGFGSLLPAHAAISFSVVSRNYRVFNSAWRFMRGQKEQADGPYHADCFAVWNLCSSVLARLFAVDWLRCGNPDFQRNACIGDYGIDIAIHYLIFSCDLLDCTGISRFTAGRNAPCLCELCPCQRDDGKQDPLEEGIPQCPAARHHPVLPVCKLSDCWKRRGGKGLFYQRCGQLPDELYCGR